MSKHPVKRSHQKTIIDRLHDLRRKVGLVNGVRYRAEFLALAFKHGLVDDICHYRLWDEGWEELGERTFDTCFEMGDSVQVIAMVVTQAKNERFLDAIRDYCNMPGAFERWLGYANKQPDLF